MKGALYKITNQINNKRYIGITFQKPPYKRWIGHKSKARNGNSLPLYNAIRKYGEDNFEFEILFENVDEEMLYQLEVEYIKRFKTQDIEYGYNLADGGKVNKGFKIPKEASIKRALKISGENHWTRRIPISEETKKKISKSRLGSKMKEESRIKMIEGLSGENAKWYGVKGENHPAYGRIKTEEEKFKIISKLPHRQEVIMLDDNDNILQRFFSLSEGARWIKENTEYNKAEIRSMIGTIKRVIDTSKKSYGYKWISVKEGQTTIPRGSTGEDELPLEVQNIQ